MLSLQRGLPQRGSKGLIYIVVRKALGIAREFLLFGSNCQGCKSLGGLPGAYIDDRLFAGTYPSPLVVQKGEVRHRIAG